MEKDVKSKGWGGKRTGAGRKSTVGNVKSFTLKVPRDVADILARVQGGQGGFRLRSRAGVGPGTWGLNPCLLRADPPSVCGVGVVFGHVFGHPAQRARHAQWVGEAPPPWSHLAFLQYVLHASSLLLKVMAYPIAPNSLPNSFFMDFFVKYCRKRCTPFRYSVN